MQNHALRMVSIFKRMRGGKPCNTDVYLGPLRSRCQRGIRHTRGFVGGMPVKNEGERAGHTEKSLQTGGRSASCERKEGGKGWVGGASDRSAVLRKSQPGQRPWAEVSLWECPAFGRSGPALLPLLRSVTAWGQPGGSGASGSRAGAGGCWSGGSVPISGPLEGRLRGTPPWPPWHIDKMRMTCVLCFVHEKSQAVAMKTAWVAP